MLKDKPHAVNTPAEHSLKNVSKKCGTNPDSLQFGAFHIISKPFLPEYADFYKLCFCNGKREPGLWTIAAHL